MPLVLVPGGQDSGLSKQNFTRNLNFKVSSSTFQSELNKLQKCLKLSSKTPFLDGFWSLFNFDWKVEDETLKFEFLMKFCFDRHPSWPLRTETSGDISCFILCFEILTTAAPSINFLLLSKWCLKYQFIIWWQYLGYFYWSLVRNRTFL